MIKLSDLLDNIRCSYEVVTEPAVIARVEKRFKSEAAVLKSLGFVPVGVLREITGPFYWINRILTCLAMLKGREVISMRWPLRMAICVPLFAHPRNLIGDNLRRVRFEKDITQTDLAARCSVRGWDISQVAIAKIESGYRSVTDVEAVLLCSALKLELSDLLASPKSAPKRVNGGMERKLPAQGKSGGQKLYGWRVKSTSHKGR